MAYLKKAAINNVMIDKDTKDVTGGGKAMENVDVSGWGGMAKISVDNKTKGTISRAKAH
jgi:hypothetical protein